jgi:hypothetical protein
MVRAGSGGDGAAQGVAVGRAPRPEVEHLEAAQGFHDRRIRSDLCAQAEVAAQLAQIDLDVVSDADQRSYPAVQQAAAGPDEGKKASST